MILIFMLISFLVIIISINSFKTLPRFIKDCNILYCIDEIPSSISILTNYNNDYLARNRKGRLEGKNSKVVELERAQGLKADGIKKEREELRNAILCIRKYSDELTLGIMAGTGVRAISCLRAWVSGLNLPRGVLRAVDENNDEVEVIHINFVLFNRLIMIHRLVNGITYQYI